MAARPKSRKISAAAGLRFGVTLLGIVSGVLIASTIAGALLDKAFGFTPFGLTTGVLLGSLVATVLVITKVARELSEENPDPPELEDPDDQLTSTDQDESTNDRVNG